MATITKKELIDRIADSTRERRVQVKRIVQQFLDEVIDELAKGNLLEFRDFGVFESKLRKARRAQNPKTLAPVAVPPKRTVKFKIGRMMKAKLGDTGDAPPAEGYLGHAILQPAGDSAVRGSVTFAITAGALRISAVVEHATPGEHGLTIHTDEQCPRVDGLAAGGRLPSQAKEARGILNADAERGKATRFRDAVSLNWTLGAYHDAPGGSGRAKAHTSVGSIRGLGDDRDRAECADRQLGLEREDDRESDDHGRQDCDYQRPPVRRLARQLGLLGQSLDRT